MPSNQPTGVERLRQWRPILVVAAAMVSTSSVEGYQIIDLQNRVDALETEQVQQIRLEEQTKDIQDDVDDLEEDIKEVDGKLNDQDRKLDLILQGLGNQ